MSKDKKKKRFIKVHGETGSLLEKKIIVDRETGVNYLWVAEGYAGGLTPLLDAMGKPIVTPINEIKE